MTRACQHDHEHDRRCGHQHQAEGLPALYRLADPARSTCRHATPPASPPGQPSVRRCGQQVDLKEYRHR